MTRNTLSDSALPPSVCEGVVKIGERIRLARRRRGISQAEMAERMFVTRKTLSRLENGEVSVSLGVLLSALWVLGLERELLDLAAPERDVVGLQREMALLPKRVRNGQRKADLDF